MLNPEIIMMVGLPGSGKSTYLKPYKTFVENGEFVEHKQYVIISTDDIIQEEADRTGKTYSELWKSMIGPATATADKQFKDALAEGKNIIWDQTNVSAKKRINVLRQVPDSYHKTANVFIVSLETLKERLTKRGQETGKHIPFNVVMDMHKRFEMPTGAEGFDEINIIGEIC